MGRPRLGDEDRQTRMLSVRLKEADAEEFREWRWKTLGLPPL